jgi:hypothetical protein
MCQNASVAATLQRPIVQQSGAIDQTHPSQPIGDGEVVSAVARRSLTDNELLEYVYLHVEEKTGRSIARGAHFIKIMPTYATRGTTWRIFHSGLDVRCGAAVDEAESQLTGRYDLQPHAG